MDSPGKNTGVGCHALLQILLCIPLLTFGTIVLILVLLLLMNIVGVLVNILNQSFLCTFEFTEVLLLLGHGVAASLTLLETDKHGPRKVSNQQLWLQLLHILVSIWCADSFKHNHAGGCVVIPSYSINVNFPNK